MEESDEDARNRLVFDGVPPGWEQHLQKQQQQQQQQQQPEPRSDLIILESCDLDFMRKVIKELEDKILFEVDAEEEEEEEADADAEEVDTKDDTSDYKAESASESDEELDADEEEEEEEEVEEEEEEEYLPDAKRKKTSKKATHKKKSTKTTKTTKAKPKTKSATKNETRTKMGHKKNITKNPIALQLIKYVCNQDRSVNATKLEQFRKQHDDNKKMNEFIKQEAMALGFQPGRTNGYHAAWVRGEEVYQESSVKRAIQSFLATLEENNELLVAKFDDFVYCFVSGKRPFHAEVSKTIGGKEQLWSSYCTATVAEARHQLDLAIHEAREILKQHRTPIEDKLAGIDPFFKSEEAYEEALTKEEAKRGLDAGTRGKFILKGYKVRDLLTEGDKDAIKDLSKMPDPTPVNPREDLDKATGAPKIPQPQNIRLNRGSIKQAVNTMKESQEEIFKLAYGCEFALTEGLLLKELPEEKVDDWDESIDTRSSLQSKVDALFVRTVEGLLNSLPEDEKGFKLKMSAKECLDDKKMKELVQPFIKEKKWKKLKQYTTRSAKIILKIAMLSIERRIFMGLCCGSIKAVKREEGDYKNNPHTALWARLPSYLIRFVCIGMMRRYGLKSRLSVVHLNRQYYVDLTNGDIVRYDREAEESKQFYLVRPYISKSSEHTEDDEKGPERMELNILLSTDDAKREGQIFVKQQHVVMYALDPYSDLFGPAQRFSVYRGYGSRKGGEFYKPAICGENLIRDYGLDKHDNIFKACQTDLEHMLGYSFNSCWTMWRCHHTVNSWLHHIRARAETGCIPWASR